MVTAYDKVAEKYIDSSTEVKRLFTPPPQPERETAFADYYKEKEGIDWTAPLEFLGKGAEQTFGTIGAIMSSPFRPRPEEGAQVKGLGSMTQEFLPGGAEYKAFQEWKEKQKPIINMPEWLGLLGQMMEIKPADVYEMGPLIFMGGGAAKKPLEQIVNYTSKQLIKGKSTEEAVNLAYQQAAKKGWIKPPKVGLTPTERGVQEATEGAIQKRFHPEVPMAKPPEIKPVTLELPPVKPPMVQPPITPPPVVGVDPTAKLTSLVRAAKPVRAETQILKHEELSQRVAVGARILEAGEGRQAFIQAKAPLKGKLPQAEFTPPEAGLTPDDITGLFNKIRDSEILYFTKLNTSEALEKLLLGQIPTRGEIALLEKVFGTDFARALLAKRPLGTKAWETFLDVWNIPRAILASWDLSAPLRQGAVLAPKHFKEWASGLKPMVKAFAKEKHALDVDRAIQTGKYAELRAEAGLYHAPISGVGSKLTEREEMFVSNLARYIPLVRRSERAYITYLNKLRSDVFDTTVSMWERTNFKATEKDFKELALFINRASGRGSLGKLEDSAPFLSGVFFSPRLQASRITIANSLFTGTTKVRKEAAATLASFVGAGISVLALADLAGAEVGKNPLSADFGKIKIGKTRLDIWGGFQQYARFLSTLVTGMKKSTISGQTYEANRMEVVQQFVRSKLMPTVSFFYDLMAGRTYIGEKMDLDIEQAYQRLAPMFVQDMVDAISAEGLPGGFVATPGILGVGIVSYDLPNWPELEGYFDLETTKERQSYRRANPENEAKLFILGRFTILSTGAARQHVLKLMKEHKIKPEDIRGYENVFGEGARPIGELSGRTWGNVRPSLDSGSLGALNRLWYGGGQLSPSESSRLWGVHKSNPMGQPVFNTWVKQTLRQSYENSLR